MKKIQKKRGRYTLVKFIFFLINSLLKDLTISTLLFGYSSYKVYQKRQEVTYIIISPRTYFFLRIN